MISLKNGNTNNLAFAHHRMIYDNCGEPVDYIFLDVNENFEKITNLKKCEIISKRVLEVLPKTENFWIKKYGSIAKQQKIELIVEYSTELNSSFSVFAVGIPNDEFYCFFRPHNSISIHPACIQQNRLSLFGENSLTMMHELNNQLSIIIGNIELLNRELIPEMSVTTKMAASGKTLHSAASNIQHIIKNVKKNMSNNAPIELLDVHKSLNEVLLEWRKLYANDGIQVTTSFEASSHMIKLTAAAMYQIILNLLSNARNALIGVKDKRLSITTRNTPCSALQILITDNGHGITSTDKHKIFNESFTTKTDGEGLGIGLILVRKMVTEANGEISFSSQAGDGTSFLIQFPVVKT